MGARTSTEGGVEFVESFALRAGAGQTGDVADMDAAIGTSFNDGCEGAHGTGSLLSVRNGVLVRLGGSLEADIDLDRALAAFPD